MLASGGSLPAVLAFAAAALTLVPSLVPRASGRAAAWAALLPNAYVTLLLATTGHAPPSRVILQMALAAFGLVVSRPLLSRERVGASFDPVALRSWFLASAIGAMASGLTLAVSAATFMHFPTLLRDSVAFVTLAVPLFFAGLGVLRMRAWGVVLGAFASLASIPLALWIRDPLMALPIVAASAPGALMSALVAVARARVRDEPSTPRVRVAPELRVASAGESFVTLDEWTPSASEDSSPPLTSAPRSKASLATPRPS